MADPQQEQSERASIIGQAGQVVSLLGEPRAFLLFLFAVLALFEWSNYHKTERMVKVISETMIQIEANRSREVSGHQQLVSDLIDILEYRNTGRITPNEGTPNAPEERKQP